MGKKDEKIIKVKNIIKKIKNNIKKELINMKYKPKVVSIITTPNPSSYYYIRNQQRIFNKVGVELIIKDYTKRDKITQEIILEEIEKFNNDKNINGILVVMPLHSSLDNYTIRTHISPYKDIEGIHPLNLGKLIYGDFKIAPCTPKAVTLILEENNINLKGKEIVIISHSEIVGKPLLMMLLKSKDSSPTITCCHIATNDLKFHTKRADIIISAVGKPKFITKDMIKEKSILIDVGINIIEEKGERKVVGDIDIDEVLDKVSLITPVPGGVGSVTTYVLLSNTISLFKIQKKIK